MRHPGLSTSYGRWADIMQALGGRTLRKKRADYGFMICVGVLLLLGLIILYSISPILSHKILGDVSRNYFLYNQLLHVGLGLVGFVFASNFYYKRWQGLLKPILIITGLSLLLLMIPALSLTKNGATRWVELGPVSFQPAELMKFSLVLLLAGWFAKLNPEEMKNNAKTLWPMTALLGVIALFVLFLQKDMGTMLVLAGIGVGVFYGAGVSLRQLGILLGIGIGMGVASILVFPHRLERVVTYLTPSQATEEQSYHLNQALIAIGSGGLFGLGIGKSVQVYGYLPEAANDSIFAIIGETFGLVGCAVILAIFGVLIYRGLRIARGAPDRYGQLLVLGIMLWLTAQTAINIAAMIGLVPLTGIPLPFLSYGGTSLVMLMTAMGIVVNVSKYAERRVDEGSTERRRDRRTYNAYPSYSGRP